MIWPELEPEGTASTDQELEYSFKVRPPDIDDQWILPARHHRVASAAGFDCSDEPVDWV